MSKSSRLMSFVVTFLSVSLLLSSAAVVSAQQGLPQVTPQQSSAPGSAGNGIRISPVRTELTINPGETKTFQITVQNITGGRATYRL